MNKKRNYYLDFWKGIACFGVVYCHTYFPIYWKGYDFGNLIKAFFRFAMPLFFMVSGYYCFYADNDTMTKKLPGKIKHIFKLNVVASIVWFAVQMMIGLLGDSHGGIAGVKEVFQSLFTTKKIMTWVLWNEDPFVKILWFLSALLYVYIIMMVVNRYNLYRSSYVVAVGLLILHYTLGNICKGINIEISSIYYRNYALMGFPFFMFGHFIRSRQDELKEKISTRMCVIFLIIGEILVIPEWFLFGKTEISIGAIVAVFAIFMLSLHLPERKEKSFMTYIGVELSLFIYIVHAAVKIVMDRVAEHFFYGSYTTYVIYGLLRVFVCFGICVVAGMVFYKLLNLIKGKKKA